MNWVSQVGPPKGNKIHRQRCGPILKGNYKIGIVPTTLAVADSVLAHSSAVVTFTGGKTGLLSAHCTPGDGLACLAKASTLQQVLVNTVTSVWTTQFV